MRRFSLIVECGRIGDILGGGPAFDLRHRDARTGRTRSRAPVGVEESGRGKRELFDFPGGEGAWRIAD